MKQGSFNKVRAFANKKGVALNLSINDQGSQELSGKLINKSLMEYELLSQISQCGDLCPFQTGYELGHFIMSDRQNLAYAEQVLKQANLASGLLASYQFIKEFYTFTGFEFSFSNYLINVSSRVATPSSECIADSALRYLILGRNLGMMCVLHKAAMFGNEISVAGLSVDLPPNESIEHWAREQGCDIAFSTSRQVTRFDSRKFRFRYFLLNQMVQQSGVESELDESKSKDRARQSIPEKVLALFNEADPRDLSKDQVASSLNLSERTFTRRLQQQGTSWRKLLSEFRIEKAKQLLMEQPDSLQHVADQVGFSSLSAFSSAFSKSEGLSPSEYLRRETNRA